MHHSGRQILPLVGPTSLLPSPLSLTTRFKSHTKRAMRILAPWRRRHLKGPCTSIIQDTTSLEQRDGHCFGRLTGPSHTPTRCSPSHDETLSTFNRFVVWTIGCQSVLHLRQPPTIFAFKRIKTRRQLNLDCIQFSGNNRDEPVSRILTSRLPTTFLPTSRSRRIWGVRGLVVA
jgi:hypothetical protein